MKRFIVAIISAAAVISAGCGNPDPVPPPTGGDAEPDGSAGDAGGDGGFQDSGSAKPFYTDAVYGQEFHENHTMGSGLLFGRVLAIAVAGDGTVWAGGMEGVQKLSGGAWADGGLKEHVTSLVFDAAGGLWACGDSGVYYMTGGSWKKAYVDPVSSLSRLGGGGVAFAGGGTAGTCRDGECAATFFSGSFKIRQAIAAGGRWYLATDAGVVAVEGGVEAGVYDTLYGLPSLDVRTVALDPDGKTVWAGTSLGPAYLAEGAQKFTSLTGLPYDSVTHIAFDLTGRPVFSTTIGAVKRLGEGSYRYYHDLYWLPGNQVFASASAPDGSLWFATDGGVGHVYEKEMTLAEKAEHYGLLMRARHNRLGYFTGAHLEKPGDTSTAFSTDDDNDGQWTGMYLGSLSFAYAVTKDEKYRTWARESMLAMTFLEHVTGAPGFFARSVVAGPECEAKQKGGGEWHLDTTGMWCWKGDTSSDEFVGHVFGLSLYYDLVADEADRAEIAATLGRILTRMIDNGYLLVDIDGQSTEHGNFDPAFMETVGVFGDAGLNGAMILGGLLAAHRMTGEQKYLDSFRYLAIQKKYREYVADTQRISRITHINHDSDEMNLLALYTLARLGSETSSAKYWQAGLDGMCTVQAPERNPEFNMICGAVRQNPEYGLADAIDTLKRIPWELVVWTGRNSHRKDITIDPAPDRFGRIQSTVVLPYDERYVMKWNENPFNLDHKANGTWEESATFWLLPYWMGRYHGLIR